MAARPSPRYSDAWTQKDGFAYQIRRHKPYCKIHLERLRTYRDFFPPINALVRDPRCRPETGLLLDCEAIEHFEVDARALPEIQERLGTFFSYSRLAPIAIFAPVIPVYLALERIAAHPAFDARVPLAVFWHKGHSKRWLADRKMDSDTSFAVYQDL